FRFGDTRRSSQLRWDSVRGWTADPPQIQGQLMSIPETRLMLRDPISSEELVGRLLTGRITEKRTVTPRHQPIFRWIISAAMARRMGLGPASGAVITGKPWEQYWAGQPILTADERRHLMLPQKVRALTVELMARTGDAAFYDGVNRFLDAGGESGRRTASAVDPDDGGGDLEELFRHLEDAGGVDLQDFWDQYFTDATALPDLRLGAFDVRREGDGYVVTGQLENKGEGVGRCPVVIKGDGQSRTVVVEAASESVASFTVELDRRPLSALLDPDRVCYRWGGVGADIGGRVALGDGR
ncbi:MAG: hypothetical protein AAFX50_05365, partial [Acidobacteriota bacterium]